MDAFHQALGIRARPARGPYNYGNQPSDCAVHPWRYDPAYCKRVLQQAGMKYGPYGSPGPLGQTPPAAAFNAPALQAAVQTALAQLQAFAVTLSAHDMQVLGIGEHLSHAEEATASGDFSRALSHMNAAAQTMGQLVSATKGRLATAPGMMGRAGTLGVSPEFAAALWNPFYSTTGIRPEWIVPVLYSESGLNPSIQNLQGYPYYGINQISASYLQARGIDPSDYLTWSAAQQLSQVVTPFMASQIQSVGVQPQSGTKVYLLNFLPAYLPTATSLTSVLATEPSSGCPQGRSSSYYCANQGFDTDGKGYIDVQDLANAVAKQAANSYVQSVIAAAYAVAPNGVGAETDPVYGLDFGPSPSAGTSGGTNWGPALGLAAGAVAAMGLWVAYEKGYLGGAPARAA